MGALTALSAVKLSLSPMHEGISKPTEQFARSTPPNYKFYITADHPDIPGGGERTKGATHRNARLCSLRFSL